MCRSEDELRIEEYSHQSETLDIGERLIDILRNREAMSPNMGYGLLQWGWGEKEKSQ